MQKHNPENWHDFFDSFNVFTNSIRLETLIRAIGKYGVPQETKILEVGLGSGATSKILADMGYAVTAIDLDGKVVSRAQGISTFPEESLTIRQMDMFQLDFPDNYFDIVIHQGVMEHFEDDKIVEAMKEQKRVARYTIFDVPNNRDNEKHYGDERFLSFAKWQTLINAGGLKIVEYTGRMCPRWTFLLPHVFFKNKGPVTSSVGRMFGKAYVFVCES